MNCSKPGSSPAPVLLEHLVEGRPSCPSCVPCPPASCSASPPLIWSTICCISCSRSLSISCSKRRWASADSKSYAAQLADLAGEVVGQHVEAHVAVLGRSAAAVSARRSSPLVSASRDGVLDGVALLVDDVGRARRRSRRRRRRGSNGRAGPGAPGGGARACSRRPWSRSPLRSRMPCCIMRRSAR